MRTNIIVSNFFPEGTCDWSGKTGEAIEVSLDDGSITKAVVCFSEFQKLLRFRHKQDSKNAPRPEHEPATSGVGAGANNGE